MQFFDLHCDTLGMRAAIAKVSLRENKGHVDFLRLKQAGVLAQCFAVWIPTHEQAERLGVTETPWEFFTRSAALFKKELQKSRDLIAPAVNGAQIRKNAQKGLVSGILTVEDGVLLEGEMDRLYTLYEGGVRLITLTWNHENSLGWPNSPVPAENGRGLTPFGRDAVREMMRLGVAVDVSHLSDGGFWEVEALSRESKVPFLASHSCARALKPRPRNLSDEMLKALGNAGGICGVNFYDGFLPGSRAGYTKTEDIVRCARYLRDKAGADAVALGSDFDGIESELELGGCEGLPRLADALSLYLPTGDVEKLCWQNALRFADCAMK